MTDILSERIKRDPPQTQEAACLLAARQSIATLGPANGDGAIRAIARGMAEGLFGEAFVSADRRQRVLWINMCERAYRAALT